MSATVVPLAVCLRDGTVFNGVTYNRGDLFYGRPGDAPPPGPVWADIPAGAELVGYLERDMSYHPPPDSGYEFYYTQGSRHYLLKGREDIPGVTVFLQDEPDTPESAEPATGVRHIDGAFKGEVHWVPPGHRHPAPPPITQRDWLRGEDVIDVPATQARDARLFDRRRDAERAEAQSHTKTLQDDLNRVLTAGVDKLPGLVIELTAKAKLDPQYTRLVQIASETLGDLNRTEQLTPAEIQAKQEASDAADARLGVVLRPEAEAGATPPAQAAPSEPVPDSEAEHYADAQAADDQASKEDLSE